MTKPAREALRNRLRKNHRHLSRWARRFGTDAFRLYDADLPEFAAAIDIYAGRPHVQEYAPPRSVDPGAARERLGVIVEVAAEFAGELAAARGDPAVVRPEDIPVKVRRRQKGLDQYRRREAKGEMVEVREGEAVFLVNLHDYLDTGLFLDHRITRALFAERAAGKRVLNLFCYTGTATVHAALRGARSSVSVDLSRVYLDWAGANFARNGLDPDAHVRVREDVWRFLECAPRDDRFDLVFLDPPTFSNSKRMRRSFEVQRDQVELIRSAWRLVATGGEMLFSNNFRGFRLDRDALDGFEIEDVTRRTLPEDFRRNPRIHQCFWIRRRGR